uniref:TLR9 n=1 Tax=Takifugu rubripes TaxID=31033 RepID=Q5H717_TAKRU|nr:TLR9 [Takifugu rubripes]|eukprot:XP_003963351.1 PREDICTED: toll-like receptor 9 [Takifugu rubripes]
MRFLILCQLLPIVSSINPIFLPCDTDANTSRVDCSDRPLRRVPLIKSDTVTSLRLSRTKIRHLWQYDLSGVPNLRAFTMADNCQPSSMKASLHDCEVKIDHGVFRNLSLLQVLNLSGNSLTSLPKLPANLRVLNLQRNHLFNIVEPLKTPHLQELYLTKNCFYANPCQQSLEISKTVFRELSRLKTLTLAYNNLTSVPEGLPSSLEILDLSENTITEVLEGAFADLTHLRELNLEWNCQRCDRAARPCFPCPRHLPLQLHSKSFYANKSTLTYLNLRGNSLRTFPKGLFQPLKNLKMLDLSDNFLSYAIQNGTFFAELTSLAWISLIYNYEPLKMFPELFLSPHIGDISGLQYLLLSGNFFHSLSGQSFEVLSKLRNLKKLELRMNFIDNINMKALHQVPSLVHIDLSQNRLSFIPQCSVSPAERESHHNQNVRDLSFSQPFLMETKPNVTFGFNFLDQSHRLETSQSFPTQSSPLWETFCKNKVTFDLSQNDIMSVNQEVLAGMENAVCLDLSFNYMSQALKYGMFSSMKHLVFLNLSYNRLDFYYNESFSELNNTLKLLDLSNNDFHFKMRGMGHRLTFIKNLVNLEVLSLANNAIAMRIDQRLVSASLKQLSFNGNDLNTMWSSENNQYVNFFHNLTSLTYLDISDNKLRLVSPEVLCNLPRSLQNLSLSNNRLNYFPWENISVLSNLRHLDLSQNFISFLPYTVVHAAEPLSLLDLSHNRIGYVPRSFFLAMNSLQRLYLSHNQLKQLNQHFLPAPFKNGSGPRTLSLHVNPFKCDCDASWFADFLRNTPIEIPHLTTNVHCEYPESQRGKTILSMDQRSCQDIYGNLASVVCSFLVIGFTVLPLLKHLYGWDLWYSLQVLWAGFKGYSQLTGQDTKYNYDAFVVFDTSDLAVRDWVYNELLVNLENSAHRMFCLCLEERDWVPGFSCIENLHNAVSSSVKTMFVLSTGTIESMSGMIRQAFFMVQQRLLDEKVDTAVLVLLDEMFPKLKYLQLRKRLCRKSVLSWPRNPKAQPLFWNQLRMALSSDNLSFYDNNMSESFI